MPFLCNKNILSPCTNSVLDTKQAHRYAQSSHSFKAGLCFFITRIAVTVSLGSRMEGSKRHIRHILFVNVQDMQKEKAEILGL